MDKISRTKSLITHRLIPPTTRRLPNVTLSLSLSEATLSPVPLLHQNRGRNQSRTPPPPQPHAAHAAARILAPPLLLTLLPWPPPDNNGGCSHRRSPSDRDSQTFFSIVASSWGRHPYRGRCPHRRSCHSCLRGRRLGRRPCRRGWPPFPLRARRGCHTHPSRHNSSGSCGLSLSLACRCS